MLEEGIVILGRQGGDPVKLETRVVAKPQQAVESRR